jgi:hypothetical protein
VDDASRQRFRYDLFDHPLPLKKDRAFTRREAMTDLSVVAGASTEIGHELAKQCIEHGFDPIIAVHKPQIAEAAVAFQTAGAKVERVPAGLGTHEAIAKICSTIGDRPVVAVVCECRRRAGARLSRSGMEHDPQGCRPKHYGNHRTRAGGRARHGASARGTNCAHRLDGRLHARRFSVVYNGTI